MLKVQRENLQKSIDRAELDEDSIQTWFPDGILSAVYGDDYDPSSIPDGGFQYDDGKGDDEDSDPSGMFDADGNPVSIYPSGMYDEHCHPVSTAPATMYDADNNPLSTYPSGMYDADGKLLSILPSGMRDKDGKPLTSYPSGMFNVDGKPLSIYPSGIFDADGEPLSVHPSGLYDEDGKPLSIYPSGMFDADGEPMKSKPSEMFDVDGNELSIYPSGGRDADGNRLKSYPTGMYNEDGKHLSVYPSDMYDKNGKALSTYPSGLYDTEGTPRRIYTPGMYDADGNALSIYRTGLYGENGKPLSSTPTGMYDVYGKPLSIYPSRMYGVDGRPLSSYPSGMYDYDGKPLSLYASGMYDEYRRPRRYSPLGVYDRYGKSLGYYPTGRYDGGAKRVRFYPPGVRGGFDNYGRPLSSYPYYFRNFYGGRYLSPYIYGSYGGYGFGGGTGFVYNPKEMASGYQYEYQGKVYTSQRIKKRKMKPKKMADRPGKPVYRTISKCKNNKGWKGCVDCRYNDFCDNPQHKDEYMYMLFEDMKAPLPKVLEDCDCNICTGGAVHNGCFFRELLRLKSEYLIFDKYNYCYCSECIPFKYRRMCLRQEFKLFRSEGADHYYRLTRHEGDDGIVRQEIWQDEEESESDDEDEPGYGFMQAISLDDIPIQLTKNDKLSFRNCPDCQCNGFCDNVRHKKIYQLLLRIDDEDFQELQPDCWCLVCEFKGAAHSGCAERELRRLKYDLMLFDVRNLCYCYECVPFKYRHTCLRQEMKVQRRDRGSNIYHHLY